MNLQSEHLTENCISTFAELIEKINPADFFCITINKDEISFLGSFNRATIDNIKTKSGTYLRFELNQESNFVETEFNYGTIKVKITLT
jgi:hypothetical protein